MEKKKAFSILGEIKTAAVTVLMALVSALNLHILVIPAKFAPGGVDGISTMLSALTGGAIGAGWFILAINIPLLCAAWFFLRRRYVIYTVLYTLCSSGFLVLLEEIEFYSLQMPEERLLVALFAGVILGIRTGIMLRNGTSTGGVDIVAGCIHKWKPHLNTERVITLISYTIILSSGFVYRDIQSVMLSLVQMFVFNITAERVLKDTRNAVEFRINTRDPHVLLEKIMYNLKHGATITECEGAFTGEKRYIITTIINMRQLPDMLALLKEDEGSFVTYSEAKGVRGNFRWRAEDEAK